MHWQLYLCEHSPEQTEYLSVYGISYRTHRYLSGAPLGYGPNTINVFGAQLNISVMPRECIIYIDQSTAPAGIDITFVDRFKHYGKITLEDYRTRHIWSTRCEAHLEDSGGPGTAICIGNHQGPYTTLEWWDCDRGPFIIPPT